MLQAVAAGRPVLVPDRGLSAWRVRSFGLGEVYREDDEDDFRRRFRETRRARARGLPGRPARLPGALFVSASHAAVSRAVGCGGEGAVLPQQPLGEQRARSRHGGGWDMSLIRYALPTLLLLYFLRRSLRQRVFLLGIPFLMFMSFSVFFDKLKPFWVPGRFSPADHLMLWLVITWVLYFDLLLPKRLRTLRERQLFGPRLSRPEEAVVVGLAGYVVVQIVMTALHYMGLGSALFEAEPFLYLMVGYFLLRGICCRAGRRGDARLHRRDRGGQHHRVRPVRAASGTPQDRSISRPSISRSCSWASA